VESKRDSFESLDAFQEVEATWHPEDELELGELKMTEVASHVFWVFHKGSRQVAEFRG
jgi:hypothetical protein